MPHSTEPLPAPEQPATSVWRPRSCRQPVPARLGATEPNALGDRTWLRLVRGGGRGEQVEHHQLHHNRGPGDRPDAVGDGAEGGGQPLRAGFEFGEGLTGAGPDLQFHRVGSGADPDQPGCEPAGDVALAVLGEPGPDHVLVREPADPRQVQPAAPGEQPPADPSGGPRHQQLVRAGASPPQVHASTPGASPTSSRAKPVPVDPS